MPALPLTAFPAGEEILIDANIIVYALGVRSFQCVANILAASEIFGIDSLATNDADFAGVPWLTVYSPTDVI
jgi:predicted nucleic acid-binding protein